MGLKNFDLSDMVYTLLVYVYHQEFIIEDIIEFIIEELREKKIQ